MNWNSFPVVLVAAMLVLTAFASVPVAAAESVTVETATPTDVTTDAATLHGTVTDLDEAANATVWFAYREEGNADNATETPTLTATGEFQIDVTDLDSNTTYVVVAHAETDNESDTGDAVTFTTDAESPLAVSTDEVTDLTDTSARLNGELTSLGGAENASVWFEYWVDGDAANRSTTASQTLDDPAEFGETVDGLANNTTYVFVAHADALGATDAGANATFTTLDRFSPLGVDTHEATDVANTSAALNGELSGISGEDEADVWFEYWVADDADNSTTTAHQPRSAPGTFSEELSGLDADTTYVVVAHASSNGTNVTGGEVEFTTGAVDDGERTWDGQGPFGQWVTSWLKNLVPADGHAQLGQLVSELVTANNPGSEHRSDGANPGGNANGPPDHAHNKSASNGNGNGPPDHANNTSAEDDDEDSE